MVSVSAVGVVENVSFRETARRLGVEAVFGDETIF